MYVCILDILASHTHHLICSLYGSPVIPRSPRRRRAGHGTWGTYRVSGPTGTGHRTQSRDLGTWEFQWLYLAEVEIYNTYDKYVY